MLLSLCWFISTSALCWGLGSLICRAFKLSDQFRKPELANMVLGYLFLGLFSTLGYRFGVSVTGIFYVSAFLSIAGVVIAGRTGQLSNGAFGTLFWVGSFGALMVPAWVGGLQYSIHQGTVWDFTSYLEASISFQKESFSYLSRIGFDEMRMNPILDTGKFNLTARPAVQLLYAITTTPYGSEILRLGYAFQIFLSAQMALAVIFVFENFTNRLSRQKIIIVALATVFGFWGQYTVDINAWSQLAAGPGFLIAAAILFKSLISELKGVRKFSVYMVMLLSSLLYMYPEGSVFFGVASFGVIALISLKERSLNKLKWFGGVATATVIVGFFHLGVMNFLFRQVSYVSSYGFPEWSYYLGYLKGRAGEVASQAQSPNIFAGLFGMYFLTAPPGISSELNFVWTTFVLVLAGLLIFALWEFLRRTRIDKLEEAFRLFGWNLIGLTFLVFAVGKFWVGSKAISFVGPYTFLFLAFIWSEVKRYQKILIAAFFIFQISHLAFRVSAVNAKNGFGYAPPYPIYFVRDMKSKFILDVSLSLEGANDCKLVAVNLSDVWFERLVFMNLYARSIPFFADHDVMTAFDRGVKLGRPVPVGKPDCSVIEAAVAESPGVRKAVLIKND